MYIIRKEFVFSAAHNLLGVPSSHPCSQIHGHNYTVTVELHSKELDEKDFVLDYRALDPIKKYIDEVLDHRHLNDVLGFNPTAENIAKHLWQIFHEAFPQVFAIEISETPKTSARYEQDIN